MTYAEAKGGEADPADSIDADEDMGDTEAREISPVARKSALAEESVPCGGRLTAAANPAATQPKKKKIGDTMPLGEALKKLLHPENEATAGRGRRA